MDRVKNRHERGHVEESENEGEHQDRDGNEDGRQLWGDLGKNNLWYLQERKELEKSDDRLHMD